jgi:hypothetical protein
MVREHDREAPARVASRLPADHVVRLPPSGCGGSRSLASAVAMGVEPPPPVALALAPLSRPPRLPCSQRSVASATSLTRHTP